MRDGVRIAIDVNLPKGLKPGEKLPAILHQTRYYRSHDVGWRIRFLTRNWPSPTKVFARRGYAWIDMDVRGTGASFGRWPYPWSPNEIRDGAEVVEWIVHQPWSNGKVGASGVSYDGGCAELLLANRHPAVAATAPMFTLFDAYSDISFPGGILLSSFTLTWGNLNRVLDSNFTPSLTALMPKFVRSSYHGVRPVDDDHDRSLLAEAVREHASNLDVNAIARQAMYRDDLPTPPGVTIDVSSPASHAAEVSASGAALEIVDGWYDAGFANAAIKGYLTLKNPSRLILGPWNHGGWMDASPLGHSPKSAFKMDGELLRFFDHYLKGAGNGIADERPVLYFTMGEQRWKSATSWPPTGTRSLELYLDAGQHLSSHPPADTGSSDGYAVDLSAGTGSASRWDLGAPVVYPDRRAADRKLLCYTSPPLEGDEEVTGHPAVTLFVSSNSTDGEFFAYIEDVDSKGRVTYVTEGELRAIHRKAATPSYTQVGPYHSFKRCDASPLLPGEVAELTFEILPTSYLFKRGHSIRLALAGADRDHFEVLAGPPPAWRVYRDAIHASRVTLPVINDE
jgi:putative CocE/NonD family hydrolase